MMGEFTWISTMSQGSLKSQTNALDMAMRTSTLSMHMHSD